MKKITFEYPYFLFCDEDPEDSIFINRQASIRPLNLIKEPYEVFLYDSGNSYHMIFGRQAVGRFLCIPNWGIGCDLASYDDIHWNETSLSESVERHGRIDYNDISAICHALKVLKPHLS